MKLLAFSDIHYAAYSTGITVADVAAVERSITDRCVQRGFKVAIFCGDRYLSHEPQDYVRVVSDQEQKHRNDLGIVTFSLVGNHDLYAKAPVSGHSSRHLQTVWGEYLPNIVVMDDVRTYRHPGAPGLAVHAIPACFPWSAEMLDLFDFQPGEFNALVFHDMLQGCVLDVGTQYKAPKGQKLELIDDARFQLVLGGDVHIAQRFEMKHTRGGYVGAAIQQSRRDRGDVRGWLEIDTENMKFDHLDGLAPRFVDAEWDLDVNAGVLPTPDEITAMVNERYDDECHGNILDFVLVGNRDRLEAVPADWSTRLCETLQARRVNLVRRGKTAAPVRRLAPIAAGRSPVDDVQAFLASGRVALDGNNPDRLLAKAAIVLKGK